MFYYIDYIPERQHGGDEEDFFDYIKKTRGVIQSRRNPTPPVLPELHAQDVYHGLHTANLPKDGRPNQWQCHGRV